MLAMSDINIEQFLPIFAEAGISVAFLVPTPTGYEKSIMDATSPVRALLKEENIHNYENQGQGPENKIMIDSCFVTEYGLEPTEASLYRPVTKKGDPRIWFKNLRKYCNPCNLLALFVFDKRIYVLNLSKRKIRESLYGGGYVYLILQQAKYDKQKVAVELLNKLKKIHDNGYIPSITPGDPGVGDTLENALGIRRNNSKAPDYKGIELKTTRLTRHGEKRAKTRSTLFTKVPDAGMSYREIVETYGKWQQPRGFDYTRLQLYDTFSTQRVNSYGLDLEINGSENRLEMQYQNGPTHNKYVSSWQIEALKSTLLTKHHETFWIKANSIDNGGIEYFKYESVLYTKKPNVSLIEPLLDSGKITIDLAAHFEQDGKWRDHGMLFKMKQDDLPLLLGTPEAYDLNSYTIGV